MDSHLSLGTDITSTITHNYGPFLGPFLFEYSWFWLGPSLTQQAGGEIYWLTCHHDHKNVFIILTTTTCTQNTMYINYKDYFEITGLSEQSLHCGYLSLGTDITSTITHYGRIIII